MADRLNAGEALELDQSLWSANGTYRLALQRDGNLVLYDTRGALWASNTERRGVTEAVMQEDGNLVAKAGVRPVWASGTDRHPGARLVVQDDGSLVIAAPGGGVVWSRGTATR